MTRLRALFSRLFDIREGEWRVLLLLYAFAFMLAVSTVWGRSASESLFLERIGIDLLPLMFVADSFLTIVATIVYAAFADRVSNTRLMVVIGLGGAAIVLLARVGLWVEMTATYPFLYLAERVMKALITLHAWIYIADFYDTRTAKRHFTLIASASRPAGIIAGLLLIPIVQLFSTENLLLVWSAALVACAWLAWATPRQVPVVNRRDDSARTPGNALENMLSGFGFVKSSRLLRYLAVAAASGTVLLFLLEYQSQRYLVHYFDTSEQLASFYGVLNAVANILVLPVQMFLLSRIINRIGVGRANFIFPGLVSAAYALINLVPSLISAAFARISYDTFRSAFRTPTENLLYNALPTEVKGRAKASISGLMTPIGSLIAGTLLISVSFEWLPLESVVVFGGVVTGLYLIVTLRIRGAYSEALTDLIRDDDSSLFRLGEGQFELGEDQLDQNQIDPEQLRRLYERLEQSDDEELVIFLAEMIYGIQGRDALGPLLRIAEARSPRIYAAVIELVEARATNDPGLRRICLHGLAHDSAAVRYASIKALTAGGRVDSDELLFDALLLLLDDPEAQVRESAIAPLIDSGDFYYLAPATTRLSQWLSSESDVQDRIRGLRVLAKSKNQQFVYSLVRYVNDTDPLVRREAVELIDGLSLDASAEGVRASWLQTLRRLLDDPDEAVRLAAVSGLSHMRGKEVSQALIDALGNDRFRVRERACESANVATADLERALRSGHRYLTESALYLLAKAEHPQGRRRLLAAVEALCEDTYILCAQQLTLEQLRGTGTELLATTLVEEREALLERIFWLLGAYSDPEKVEAVRIALTSSDPLKRANATETLESLASPRLAYLIAPLHSDQALSKLVRDAQKLLGFPTQTLWHTLQRAWPELFGDFWGAPERTLSSYEEDGWLKTATIYTLAHIDLTPLGSGLRSPFAVTATRVQAALEATLNQNRHAIPDSVRDTIYVAKQQFKPLQTQV